MDLDILIDRLIPPCDRQHREGFCNKHIVDELNSEQRDGVEVLLIERLRCSRTDTLIYETLAYLRSVKSLPLLYEILPEVDIRLKLPLSTSIYSINGDEQMIKMALATFNSFDKKSPYYKYDVITALGYLSEFRREEVDAVIRQYVDSTDYLIAYNAKRVLGNPG